MNAENHKNCCHYLSVTHKISLEDAKKMLKAMSPKDVVKTVGQAKNSKQKAQMLATSKKPAQSKTTHVTPYEPFAKPLPKSQVASAGSKLFSLMIPLEDIERLKRAAKDNGEPVAALIRAAIKNHLIHYK